jgi:thioredoxin
MIKEECNMALAFNDSNFQDEVLNSEIPVLVDFYADWCGPCKMMSPVVDELSREYEGRLKVGKVNVDENTNVAQQYRVMSIPTILLIKNGQVVDQVVGAVPKAQLTGKIDSIL